MLLVMRGLGGCRLVSCGDSAPDCVFVKTWSWQSERIYGIESGYRVSLLTKVELLTLLRDSRW